MITDSSPECFDVIVIGGSYAGLSAALQLARARRRILVLDAGARRNRFAQSSHGFLTQDGAPPADIAAAARAQLLAYPTVHWENTTVVSAQPENDRFHVTALSGQTWHAKRLLLASGVVDELPDIEGLHERWGRHVFHCPYCHGYELNQGAIGVIAVGEVSLHHALMLPDWGQTTFFLNGRFSPTREQHEQLHKRGVFVESRRILRVTESATVVLEDNTHQAMAGLFVAPRTHIATELITPLGCEVEQGPMGPFIKTSQTKETSVPGVFACGDIARAAGSVALSVGDGALAGAALHQSLMFR